MRKAAGLVACVLLAGCVASGVNVKEGQLSALQPGVTTRDEAVAALGSPTTQMRNADGSSTLIYNYVEASARPETYIPFVGAFIGGADSRTRQVMLKFDASGKLVDHSSSDSAHGTGLGLSAGQVDRVADQPRK